MRGGRTHAAAPFKNHFEEGRGAGKVHVTKVTKSHELSLDLFFADDNDTRKKRISLIHIWFSVPFLSLSLARNFYHVRHSRAAAVHMQNGG